MKKTVLALMLSAVMGLSMLPSSDVYAAERDAVVESVEQEVFSGSFTVNVPDEDEEVIGGSYDDTVKKPAEKNASRFFVYKALNEGKKTTIFVAFDKDDKDTSSLNFHLYEGEVQNSDLSWTSYKDYVSLSIKVTQFTGAKKFTVAAFDSNYDCVAAKEFTVTPETFQGSISVDRVSSWSANDYIYMNAYLPAELSGKEVQVGLYDGDSIIGLMKEPGLSEGRSLSMAVDKYYFSYYADSKFPQLYGYMKFSKKLSAGKTYTVKAACEGKTYSLGEIVVDDSKEVSYAGSDTSKAGYAPVIRVSTAGYKADEVVIELQDKDGAVVADSVGGKVIKRSNTYLLYQLVTNKTIDELDGTKIVVKDLTGKVLYNSNTFRSDNGIADAYYAHVSKAVVAHVYNIPAGTKVSATVEDDDDTYLAEGVVDANGILTLQFTLNGVATGLPYGSHEVEYSYQISSDNENDNEYVQVYGPDKNVSENYISFSSVYAFTNEQCTLSYRVSNNNLTGGTDRTMVVRNSSNEEVLRVEGVREAYLNSDNVPGEKISVVIPANTLPADNYSVALEVGGKEIEEFSSFYMMEPGKIYGRLYTVTNDKYGKGVEVYIPYKFERQSLNKNLFAVTLKDVIGNAVPFTATSKYDSESPYYREFYIDGDTSEYLNLTATASYGDQILYDIDKIKKGVPESLDMNVSGNLSVLTYSYYDDERYFFTYGVNPNKDCIMTIYENGTFNALKVFELKGGELNKFTAEMLNGLVYNNDEVAYDLGFVTKDGMEASLSAARYLGIRQESSNSGNSNTGNNNTGNTYTGLALGEDGNWYLYSNGVFQSNYTGLYCDANLGWWYVENGAINFGYNGLVELGGTWWCVAGGAIAFDYTGLWFDENVGWWYVENGAINFGYNGLVELGGTWWCVAGGAIAFDYTGLWYDENVGWWYVENGAINFGYNGLVELGGAWWCVAGGAIAFDYTGLWFDPVVGWWYVQNGTIDFGYNGLVELGGVWWCVAGGAIAFDYTGLWFDPVVGWWYVENGAINFAYNGLVELGGVWWCVAGGAIAFDYTGLWNDPVVGWWYVENGIINFAYTGTAANEFGTWNVVGGQLIF